MVPLRPTCWNGGREYLDDGNDPCDLVLRRDVGGARTRRVPANVDDVCARARCGRRVGERGGERRVIRAVGERVGRHVESGHQAGVPRDGYLPVGHGGPAGGNVQCVRV
jgi:hypothetical protein